MMRPNTLLVWQIRLWLLALAAVLLLGNTRDAAGDKRGQQIGTAQQGGCSVGVVTTRASTPAGAMALDATGAKKCRAASVTPPRGEQPVLAGG